MNKSRLKLRSIPKPIADRLSDLRRRLTVWVLVKGLSRWLLLVLAIIAADVLIDRFFKMDFAQRLIMLIVMTGLAIGLFYWRLVKPLLNQISDDALLHEVEIKHPELKENLISGAQLAQIADLEEKGVSQNLADATISRSIDLARKLDFSKTINQNKLLKNAALLGFGFVVLLSLAVAVPMSQFFGTWFNRNVLLGDSQWPQATYLSIVGANNGVLVLPRGTDHRLIVQVTEDSRVQEVDVAVEIDNPNGQSIHQMKPTGKLDGREHLFVMHNVSSELTLRARGGDDLTPTVTVKLVEPPTILELDMWAVLPPYTKTENQNLEGPGPHSVLSGSLIEGVARVNKPLREFFVDNENDTVQLSPTAQPLEFEIKLPNGNRPLPGGQYQFRLVDQSGLASTRPNKFVISIKDDSAPKVLASLLGISGLAVPRARIPVSYNATDEFGLTYIGFHCNWKNSDSGDQANSVGRRDIPIADHQAAKQLVRNQQDVAVLDIESFKFEPGTSFRLLVRAADTKPVEPNSSDSAEFLIRIVSEEELRADLLRREIEQRKAFQRAYDAQLELSAELQAVAAMQRTNAVTSESFESDRQSRMINLAREQKLIGTNLDSIANRFEEFLVEAENNRLDEEEKEIVGAQTMSDRFDNQIIRPIRALDQDLVSMATRSLDNCRRLLDDDENLMNAVDQTTLLHQQILDEMKKIMGAMVQSETFQEVVNKLLEIKRGEDLIKNEIKRRKPDENDIFDEDDIFDDE